MLRGQMEQFPAHSTMDKYQLGCCLQNRFARIHKTKEGPKPHESHQ